MHHRAHQMPSGVACQKQDWKTHKTVCRVKPPTTHCTGCRLKFGGENGKPDELCPDPGTCYCEDSNFGHKYCGRVPEWYHRSSRTNKLYRGDNHPAEYDAQLHTVPSDKWEKEPRKCGNCGESKLCLVPGYLCKNSLCQ
ncbi:hypothetical protein K438DRAFT_1822105 [Mycena galopus ATCC 62051]|nr:hypothetical protein K438DRAFT_1822105 [Mycena galopus ATCC 62051]